MERVFGGVWRAFAEIEKKVPFESVKVGGVFGVYSGIGGFF
jgi:hypothetical protein